MAPRERDFNFADRMSEHEALMWNIEKDPWLNPSGASLTMLDKPMDMDRFRRQIRHGMTKLPRLYQRVVPGLGRLSTPAWVPDAEFDLDYHVREIQIPAPGTDRDLFDLATQIYQEPLDRTRPLWRFVAIRGLEGGRGAVYAIIHHAISDGIGQLRMAELYQQLSPDEPAPPDVDLDQIITDAVAAHGQLESGGDLATSLLNTTGRTLGHLLRRQAGIARRVAGDVAIWPADPERAADAVGGIAHAVRSTLGQLTSGPGDVPGGSPLWKTRSRHRHLEHVRVPVADLKAAAKSLGGTINEAFLVGLTEAAVRYHAERDTAVEAFNTSFVVSTRKDNSVGGNAFTPVPVQVSGLGMSFADRMAEVHEQTNVAREDAQSGGALTGLSAFVNLLPTSVVTRTARAQSARIDFATSNLRGAPFPLYCVGSKVSHVICMGPVAGTAANITAMSYDGNFDIGMFIDPVAIEDPEGFRRHVEAAFADLVATPKPTVKKAAAKKPVAKKAPVKKPVAKRAAAKKPVAKRPAASKPVAKRPAVQVVAAKTVAAKTSAAANESAAADKAAAKKPVVKKPAVKKPAPKKAAVKKPVAKRPAANKPAAKKPAASKPAAKKVSASTVPETGTG